MLLFQRSSAAVRPFLLLVHVPTDAAPWSLPGSDVEGEDGLEQLAARAVSRQTGIRITASHLRLTGHLRVLAEPQSWTTYLTDDVRGASCALAGARWLRTDHDIHPPSRRAVVAIGGLAARPATAANELRCAPSEPANTLPTRCAPGCRPAYTFPRRCARGRGASWPVDDERRVALDWLASSWQVRHQGGRGMSSQFQVDTARIGAAAGDVQRISAEIESSVAAMMARLTGLQDAWQGEAAARFQGVVQEWRGTQTRVRESLEHISRLLGQAGQQYAAAEQQNAALFRS